MAGLLAIASCARGARRATHATAPPIGAVELAVSCAPAVRADFERAVALLHHMTYVQARSAFRAIATRDPRCAMAHWGVAMTLFQPLWPTRPSAADLQAGWREVQRALALGAPTARERAYVEMVAAFFAEPEAPDYWQRIDRWAAQARALLAAFPDDVDATAFHALALLASARPGPQVAAHSREAVALLLPILRRHPAHPGAMHYIVHANDVTGRERENLDVVGRYEQVAPDNPHALHMPTHIYTRLGDWEGVIRGNRRAAEAALRYPAGEHGELVWDEFPHAIEYLVYAYLQRGDDRAAAAALARLSTTPNLEPSAKTAFHLASTRARYALERHAWAEAAALVPREPAFVDWDRFPWAEAVTWFARGYGAARRGDRTEPARALARLGELEQRAHAARETVFAQQIAMLRLMLDGWSTHVAGDDARAVRVLQEAVTLEGATPKPAVTPAATLPAAEVLGDLLLALGRAPDAASAYRDSLQRYPRRFNGTLGLARALAAAGDAAGDAAGATHAYCELIALGASGARVTTLAELRPYRTGPSCRAH